MKNPKNYLKDYIRPLDGIIELHTGDGSNIIQIIQQAQIDAYNEALQDVIKKGKVTIRREKPHFSLKPIINKRSINRLKK